MRADLATSTELTLVVLFASTSFLFACAASPPPRAEGPRPPAVSTPVASVSQPRSEPRASSTRADPEGAPHDDAPSPPAEPDPDATAPSSTEPERPRVVRIPAAVGYAYPAGGEPPAPPPEPEIPDGYVRPVDLADNPPFAYPRSIFRRSGDREDGERSCEEWTVRRTEDGVVLEHRHRERYGRRGVAIETERLPLTGGPVAYDMFSTGYERRWIRRPDPRDGLPGLRGAHGCVTPVTIVAADDERIVWVEAHGVLAYHPDDAHVWFRTAEACRAAPPTDSGGC